MSFRARILLLTLVFAWAPLMALGILVRQEGVRRLQASQTERMEGLAASGRAAWNRTEDRLNRAAERLAETLEDNEVRAAVQALPLAHPRIQDAVEGFSRASGLAVAYVVSEGGLILGASHFPGDVGRVSDGIWNLAGSPDALLAVGLPGPDGAVAVLAVGREVRVGPAPLRVLVGLEPAELGDLGGGDGGVFVARTGRGGGTVGWMDLEPLPGADTRGRNADPAGNSTPSGEVPPDGLVELGSLVVGSPSEPPDPGRLVLAWWDPVLPALTRSFDRALLLALVVTGTVAALLAPLLATRLARPLERLGDTARRVHLGRLDVRFRGEGGNEFRRLSRFLNGMLDRLRAGVTQVREAERRATLGELARQVNHDVRNGLVPIRNVLAHLGEANDEGPDALAQAFSARRTTLGESLNYLDELAQQYRSVSIHGQRAPADLDATVAGSVEAIAATAQGVVFETMFEARGRVRLDPVSLRRVAENLIRNAVDAVGESGAVRIRTGKVEESGETAFQLEVSDDGPGIPAESLSRVFEPFFTTRADGTGLGLAIVRRMVSDVGGRVTLDSREGKGTTVRVILPAQGDTVPMRSDLDGPPGHAAESGTPKGAS